MRGTGVSFNSRKMSQDKNSVDGFNQSISTPAAQLRFRRMDEDNRVLGKNIIQMKPTVNFKKNSEEYEQS